MCYVSGNLVFKVRGGQEIDDVRDEFRRWQKVYPRGTCFVICVIVGAHWDPKRFNFKQERYVC